LSGPTSPISGWKALVVSSTTNTVFISPVAWSLLMPATLPTPTMPRSWADWPQALRHLV